MKAILSSYTLALISSSLHMAIDQVLVPFCLCIIYYAFFSNVINMACHIFNFLSNQTNLDVTYRHCKYINPFTVQFLKELSF